MTYFTKWSILFVILMSLLLFPQAASSQGISETPSLPRTVPEASARYNARILRLASERMLSQEEAKQLFLDSWKEGLSDGAPFPSIFTEAQVIALQDLGVSFEDVSVCEYVILPDNVSLSDYAASPDRYKDPSCLLY